MLEIRNLTKIYKSKGGVIVKALDGVSIKFPSKGLVFLLGKSGSGKSTLLNVTGGLDKPDDGEIIIKGRNSKSFSSSDFDSYRNTFIGFIFQEYNILNEFNVEQNISLALQLQGKKNDKQAVDKILEAVDLSGYGKRKPNTLSGGQKQRIAIARALIKNPEIIMADEPTGALDSNTGKQVFDTLKKLSLEKLIIVVSHDRDFAEYYGDRIIELSDGKIISDVTKETVLAKQISNHIEVINDNVISIKNAKDMTKDAQKSKADVGSALSDAAAGTAAVTAILENADSTKADEAMANSAIFADKDNTSVKGVPLKKRTIIIKDKTKDKTADADNKKRSDNEMLDRDSDIIYEVAPKPRQEIKPLKSDFTNIPRLESVKADEYNNQYDEMKKSMPKNQAYLLYQTNSLQ